MSIKTIDERVQAAEMELKAALQAQQGIRSGLEIANKAAGIDSGMDSGTASGTVSGIANKAAGPTGQAGQARNSTLDRDARWYTMRRLSEREDTLIESLSRIRQAKRMIEDMDNRAVDAAMRLVDYLAPVTLY